MTMPPVRRGGEATRVLFRGVAIVAVIALAAAVATVILLSPVAVGLISRGSQDWSQLSEIGQAYGGVSALLSAVALAAVVLLQRGQVRHERAWLLRERHLTVVKMALDDPFYAQCWGPRMAPDGVDERLFYYVNLILLLWQDSWIHGDISDDEVCNYAAGLFGGAVGREYWSRHGSWRLSLTRGRRRRFLRLIDGEFRLAVSAGPPIRLLEPSHDRPRSRLRSARSVPDRTGRFRRPSRTLRH
ncbi:DUF6082 family protein [Catenuloplanes japonicus]|uniref:DUF6082 family protein n=1 Tax=Catenuloplanes japonicus TaxID=33876 RepID=UPI000527A637|nr:DUF6082 family protein [Catenuloplanes japonicus]